MASRCPTLKSKIKVNVEALLAAVEQKAAKDEKQYDKDEEKYESELATWRDKAAQALVKAGEKLSKSDPEKVSVGYRGNVSVNGVKFPDKPSKPVKRDHSRVINTLRIASEPTISISVEDYGNYLGD